MRRILIDAAVEERVKEYVEIMKGNMPLRKKWSAGKTPIERLKAFYKALGGAAGVNREASLYVYNIISLYESLLTLQPCDFQYVYQSYFQQWDGILTKKIVFEDHERPFYEHVIACMGYKDIRSNLLRQYMKDQGIKACVYCNAQYAVTTEEFDDEGVLKRVGTYQFDHLLPEAQFPFLCTSYFNLQPCCPTCNQSKLTRDALFNLYTAREDELDVFRFKLTPDKAAKAYVADDMDKLELKLDSDDDQLLENHQRLFHIDLIYTEHLDVAKRIIVLLRNNSPYYQKSLQEGLKTLFPFGVEDPGYFFFGYYMKKENIHLQPLSKMVQDVVEAMTAARA